MQTVGRPPSDRPQKILFLLRFLFVFAHHNSSSGLRLLGFGHEHFRHKQRAGRSHDHRAQQMLGFDSECDVGCHDAARNVRHAAGHHGHQFGPGEIGQERTDGQRSFGLSHENAGGHIQRLRSAGPHHTSHDPGGDLDNKLHDAVVVEHGEKCRDEDDGWQYLEGKIKPEMGTLLPEFAKHKLGADESVTKQSIHHITGFLKHSPASFDSQYKYGEDQL